MDFDAVTRTFFDHNDVVDFLEETVLKKYNITESKRHCANRVEGELPEIPFPVPEHEKEAWTLKRDYYLDDFDLSVDKFTATDPASPETRKMELWSFNTDGWLAMLQYDDKFMVILNTGHLYMYTNGHAFQVTDRNVYRDLYTGHIHTGMDMLDWFEYVFDDWLIMIGVNTFREN